MSSRVHDFICRSENKHIAKPESEKEIEREREGEREGGREREREREEDFCESRERRVLERRR